MAETNLNRAFLSPKRKALRMEGDITLTTVELTSFCVRVNFAKAFKAAPKVTAIGTDSTYGRAAVFRMHAEADTTGVTIWIRSGATPSGLPAATVTVYADVEGLLA